MWFLKMLTDQNGNESSKRFIAFVAMVQVIIIANRQAFGKDVSIDKDIWWGLIALVCTGIGLAAAEFFAKKTLPKN